MLLMHNAFSHVLFKGACNAERHLTKPTFELIVAHPAVGLHVSGQLAALSAGVGTQLAGIRFLSRMTSSVHCQVAAVLKNLSTVLAGVVPAPTNQVLSCIRVKNGVEPSFLRQGLDSAWFHSWHLHSVGKGGKGNVFQAAPPAPLHPCSPPSHTEGATVRGADSGHPQAGEQILLLPGEHGRWRRKRGRGGQLGSRFGLELPNIVVDILLQSPSLTIFLLRLPVGFLVLLDVVEAKLVHQLPDQAVLGGGLGERGGRRGRRGKTLPLAQGWRLGSSPQSPPPRRAWSR